jgi:hypothetical protein
MSSIRRVTLGYREKKQDAAKSCITFCPMRRHREQLTSQGQFLAYIAKDFKLKNNSAAEIGDVLGGDTNATEAAMCGS